MPATTSSTKQAAEVTFTLHHPPHIYFHLQLQTESTQSDPTKKSILDEVTLCQYLAAALQQFLGLTGLAIPIDILRVDGLDAWIRLPYDDGRAVSAALSQWTSASRKVSLRIVAKSSWLAGLVETSDQNTLWTLKT